MAISLQNITVGKKIRPSRIILTGKPKIGKSTFAANSHKPVIIPIKGEEGIDDLDVASFPTCCTFQEVMDCLKALYLEEHDYGTVVIDSASALEFLVWNETCRLANNAATIERIGGGFGKGYNEALKQWKRLTDGLDALRDSRNMASILIGHVKVKSFNEPGAESYDQYQFDVQKEASAYLTRWSDSVLFCNTKVFVKTTDSGLGKEKAIATDIAVGKRFLYTQERATHPGGGRGPYGELPYELPLDWNVFIDEVGKAIERRNNK